MKNHWLRLHEQKKKRFWTTEFSKNGTFVLKPRCVEVLDSKYALGYMGATSGKVGIVFKGGMTNINDHELVDFLHETRKGMSGLLARLRHYQGLTTELEYFELYDLTYNNIGMGIDVEDLKFEVSFNRLRRFHVA